MAHFYGSMQGNRGEATRMGTKDSGFYAHIRGWDVGVRVELYYNEETEKDEIFIYKTGGSNGRHSDKLLYKIVEGE